MRNSILIAAALSGMLLVSACAGGAASATAPQIQTGDILFVGLPMTYDSQGGMDSAIIDATGGDEINYIHAAILEVDSLGVVWVIDATTGRGVDRHPLDTLLKDFTLKDGSSPHYEIMRLKDNSKAGAYVQNAKQYIGEEYDLYFLPENGRHYCTELVYDSYSEEGKPLFGSKPMNFKDKNGEFPAYWVNLFQRINQQIPQDVPGTNPQDMHKDPNLELVTIL